VVGTGRVIFFLEGQIILSFSWSLGITINNQAWAYTFFKGLSMAQSQEIETISILGDSKVIINHVRKRSLLLDMMLKNVLMRTLKET
jgi:ribonuclease HI